jgi:hypothetical protein
MIHVMLNNRMLFQYLMNKVLFAVPLAAILAVSMLLVPALAAGSYTIVKAFKVQSTPASDDIAYGVTTSAPIPKEANDYINSLPLTVLGYGWLDTSTLETDGVVTGVFATIHPLFDDSTYATGDKWHAHTGLVAPVEDSNGDTILCLVQLSSPDYSLAIAGSALAQKLSSSDTTVTNADAATSFTLQPNDDCPNVEVPLVGALPIQVVAPAP